ncbi:MAG: hypothetical protein WCW33_02715 [Candidatus Babeliales bacterium]|jgi:hypothetical protein
MNPKFVLFGMALAASIVCTQVVAMGVDPDEQKTAQNNWSLNDIELLDSYDFFDKALVLTTESWSYFPKSCSGSVCFSFSSTYPNHFLLKRVTELTIALYKTDGGVFIDAEFSISKAENNVPFQFLIPDNELSDNPPQKLIFACLNQLLGIFMSCEQGTLVLDERCTRCGKPIGHPNYGKQAGRQNDDESLIVVKNHCRTKCDHILCKRCFGPIYTACPCCSTNLGSPNDVIRVVRHSNPLSLLRMIDSMKIKPRHYKKGHKRCKK